MISAMRVRSDANVATMMRPSAFAENFFKIALHGFFGNGVAGFFGVRAVYHKAVNAHLADTFEFFEALRFALVVVVNAKVGEVHDVACRRFHQNARRFGNRVRHAEEDARQSSAKFSLRSPFFTVITFIFGEFGKSSCRFSMIAFVIDVA